VKDTMPLPSSSSPANSTSRSRSRIVLTDAEPANTPDGTPVLVAWQQTPTPALQQITNIPSNKTSVNISARGNSPAESIDELSIGDMRRRLPPGNDGTVVKISRSKTSSTQNIASVQAIPTEHIQIEPEVVPVIKEMNPSYSNIEPPAAFSSNVKADIAHASLTGKPSRTKKRPSEDLFDEDDLTIGLSKEQYKPRPSRSRSTQLVGECPIDYSKRTEQLSKSNPKRRKTTTDFSNNTIDMSTSEKAGAIEDMGFSPNQTRKALKQSSGNMDLALDHLIAQSGAETEHASSKKVRRGHGSSRSDFVGVQISPPKAGSAARFISEEVRQNDSKPLIEEAILMPNTEDAPKPLSEEAKNLELAAPTKDSLLTSTHVGESDYAADDEPVKEPKTRQLSQSRRKSTKRKVIEDEDEDICSPSIQEEPKEIPKEKKRGRGRPRKSIDPHASALPSEHDPETSGTPRIFHQESLPVDTSALHEIALNVLSSTPKNSADKRNDTHAPTATPPETSPPAATPEQKKTSMKCSSEHSPISKAKVPLRVGLSRRTRIAPLLRIIKK
jgi:hypothetical protein